MTGAPRLVRCVAPIVGWRIGEVREVGEPEAVALLRDYPARLVLQSRTAHVPPPGDPLQPSRAVTVTRD